MFRRMSAANKNEFFLQFTEKTMHRVSSYLLRVQVENWGNHIFYFLKVFLSFNRGE